MRNGKEKISLSLIFEKDEYENKFSFNVIERIDNGKPCSALYSFFEFGTRKAIKIYLQKFIRELESEVNKIKL